MFKNHTFVKQLLAQSYTALKLGATGVLILRGVRYRLEIGWPKHPTPIELLTVEIAGSFLYPLETSVLQSLSPTMSEIMGGLHLGIRPLVELISPAELARVYDQLQAQGSYQLGDCSFSLMQERAH